jgi:hypothetical protein
VHAELHFSSESKCHVFVVVHFRFTFTVTIGNVMAKSSKSVVHRIAMPVSAVRAIPALKPASVLTGDDAR